MNLTVRFVESLAACNSMLSWNFVGQEILNFIKGSWNVSWRAERDSIDLYLTCRLAHLFSASLSVPKPVKFSLYSKRVAGYELFVTRHSLRTIKDLIFLPRRKDCASLISKLLVAHLNLYSRYYTEVCNEWCRVHLRSLAPEQHSSQEISNVTGPVIGPSCTDSDIIPEPHCLSSTC